MHAMTQLAGQQRQNLNVTAGTASRPLSEVDGELNSMEGAVRDMNQLVVDLIDRLGPALLPAALGNESALAGQAPQVVMSPLAESVRGSRQRLEATTDRLRAAMSRLAI